MSTPIPSPSASAEDSEATERAKYAITWGTDPKYLDEKARKEYHRLRDEGWRQPPPKAPHSREHWPAAPRQDSDLIAFVLGLAGVFTGLLAIPAVILGHLSLSRAKRNQQKGNSFALWGAILGWIGVIGMVTAIIVIIAIVVSSHSSTVPCDPSNPNWPYC